MDSSCIAELFCPENEKKGQILKKITNYQNVLWNSFLNMKHKLFKNKHYTFYNEITTDGISCSLLFIRKDCKGDENKNKQLNSEDYEYISIEELDNQQLEVLKSRNIVGLDPGKRSLVYMMDGQGNKLQYTAPQRKKESMTKRNQQILQREKYLNKINEYENTLSFQNSKSVDYEKFKMYLVEKNKLNKETSVFYKREVWRKMKFRQYSYGNKSIDTFLNNIENIFGRNILICYGNWSRTTQMKGKMSSPGIGIKRLLHSRFEILETDEFRTSKLYNKNFKELTNIKVRKGKHSKSLHQVLTLKEETEKCIRVNSDKNACMNILLLGKYYLEHQSRPKEFQREKQKTNVKKAIKLTEKVNKSTKKQITV